MIEQFVAQAAQKLGVSQQDAEQAISGLLSMMNNQGDSSAFSQFTSKFAGAEALMNKYEAGNNIGAPGAQGGLMGGLMSAATSLLGKDSSVGKLAGLAALVSQINLDSNQLSSLASMFFNQVKSEGGADMASKLMGGLGNFLQDDSKAA